LQFIDSECRAMGRNNKEVGAMPTWNWLTFMCCQPCLPNFQCYQNFVSINTFTFSPAMSVMP